MSDELDDEPESTVEMEFRRINALVCDLDLPKKSIKPRAAVGGFEIALRLVDRVRGTYQDDVGEAPQRERWRNIRAPRGGKQDVGVEESAVGFQRACRATCGTASGSRPSALTSRRATSYSAAVAALFSRNSALRATV